jgi:GNAT superfamily N-acetyltransferase
MNEEKLRAHEEIVIRGGDRVVLRPIGPADLELDRRFIEALSPASRRFRFLETILTPSDALLNQLTVLDPATDVAIVAVVGEGSRERAVGVGRFSAYAAGNECEFALTVADDWQQKGLGTVLMARLMDHARARGLTLMHSSDAADNALMRKFAAHVHLRHETDPEDATLIRYSVDIAQDQAPATT